MGGAKLKTNKYSVYMIKPEIQDLQDIAHSSEPALEIPDVGTFLFEQSHPRPPSWVPDFFGSTLDQVGRLVTSSARGILIVPITNDGVTIKFVVSFGFGRYMLKTGVIEERFGLKVVLNSLDASSLRSIDKTTLGSIPKQSHEQMSREVAPGDFGIDIEQDLISAVTGKSRDVILGNIITGKDALNGSAKVDAANVKVFLAHCLDRYRSKNYVANFGWIDQIAEVRDRSVVSGLDTILVDRLNNDDLGKIWMAVPEVVDWADIKGFQYIRASERTPLHDDLNVVAFQMEFDDAASVDALKERRVFMLSASRDEVVDDWSTYQCLYAEIEFLGQIYILNNAKWYRIARGFTDQVQRDFDEMRRSDVALPDCTVTKEGEYNKLAAASLKGAYCMDGSLIMHGGGHSSVEFCDILTADDKLLHIKRYGGSSVLSHLFSQGVVSGELFVSDSDFRKKLNEKLPPERRLQNTDLRPDPGGYDIVFGVISEHDGPLDLPFFSKVSLRNARQRLSAYGYNVALKQIRRTVAPSV
jgi:uncharacterized protein (TIGR04141 family)